MRLAALLCLALAAPSVPASPLHLRDTGLDTAQTIPFSPQYPLWSDGTKKRRWLYLPPATSIDASRPDAWEFPRGTRLWKELSFDRRIETRMIERLADGSWRFAAYVWNAQQTEAVLAPEAGTAVAVQGAPGGRYAVPSRNDCLACHEGAAVPVLGFSALQLSADLRSLSARGLVRNLPPALLAEPPRIAAPTPAARAALGYLHGNCGHCHNEAGPLAGVDLALSQHPVHGAQSVARTLRSLSAGRPGARVLAERMRSHNPLMRMPPLGVTVVDSEGLALVERWIQQDLQPQPERSP